jgi:hypothetical protein
MDHKKQVETWEAELAAVWTLFGLMAQSQGCGVAAALNVKKVKDAGFVTACSCCQEGFDGDYRSQLCAKVDKITEASSKLVPMRFTSAL